jgi:hypothetical protein
MILIVTQPHDINITFVNGHWESKDCPELADILNISAVASRSTLSEIGLDAIEYLQEIGAIFDGEMVETEPMPEDSRASGNP